MAGIPQKGYELSGSALACRLQICAAHLTVGELVALAVDCDDVSCLMAGMFAGQDEDG